MNHDGNHTGLGSSKRIDRILTDIEEKDVRKAAELKEVAQTILEEDPSEIEKMELIEHITSRIRKFQIKCNGYYAIGIYDDGKLVIVEDVEEAEL